MKNNDFFLNTISNPDFTPEDFTKVGLTPDNTSLESKLKYSDIDALKLDTIFLTNGKFDLSKFDKLYLRALDGYKTLTATATNNNIGNNKVFSKYNIFAPKALKEDDTPTYKVEFVGNPHRQSQSFRLFGAIEAPTKSDREIAETKKVWDSTTKSWQAAPEDSFFDNFFETRVLAQYDEDVKDKNGNIIHKKGEKKIDPITGTYYYENLNGRDIYGREVLSKFDVLTKEDSALNKFDFFDSDDIDKHTTGSIMRNALKIIPAFIPGVAPWYIGARVGLSTTDLMAKLGKMVTGSESPILSGIEGFSKSFNFSSSDKALEKPWSMENLLNLTSDVFTQLAELRWLFKYAPSLMKGTKLGFSKEALEEFKNNMVKKLWDPSVAGMVKDGTVSAEKLLALKGVATIEANLALLDKIGEMSKIGEYLSKAYMTGVTVADSYGEAKLAGYNDLSAALFTLGYAAGEYGILNTQLGEMILPELRMEKALMKNIIKKTLGDPKELDEIVKKLLSSGDNDKKLGFFKGLIQKGANVAKNYWSGKLDEEIATSAAKMTLSHLGANALGEGVEEVSEELLADFSKTLSNTVASIIGSDKRMNAFDTDENGNIQWDQLISRYGLNFVGGAIGGGLGQALPSYREALNLRSLDLKSAYEELVHLVANNKGEELKKVAREMTLGNEYLGVGINENGDFSTGGKSLDLLIKDHFDTLIDDVLKILKSNRANLSDESFMRHLALEDLDKILNNLKMLNLSKSDAMGSYLLDWNSTLVDIVKLTKEINDLENPAEKTDSLKNELTVEQQLLLADKKALLKQALERKDMYLDGTMSKEFIMDALFEMSDSISSDYESPNFISYALAMEKKPLHDIPKPRLDLLKRFWSSMKESGTVRDRIHLKRLIFTYNNLLVSDSIKGHNEAYYLDNPEAFSLDLLDTLIMGRKSMHYLIALSPDILTESKGYLDEQGITSELSRDLQTTDLLLQRLSQDLNDPEVEEMRKKINLGLNLPNNVQEWEALSDEDKYTIMGGYIRELHNLDSPRFSLEEIDHLNEAYAKVKNFKAIAEDTTKSREERLLACANINKSFPDYHASIDENGNYILDAQGSVLDALILPKYEELLADEDDETIEFLQDLAVKSHYLEIDNKAIQTRKLQVIKTAIREMLTKYAEPIKNLLQTSKYAKHSIKEHLKNYFDKYYMFANLEDISLALDSTSEFQGRTLEDVLESFSGDITGVTDAILDENGRDDLVDNLLAAIERGKNISAFHKVIDELKSSPVEELIDKFQISLKANVNSVSKLIQTIVKNLNAGILNSSINLFNMDDDMYLAINDALEFLKIVRSHLLAARTDGVDVDNILGFNHVANLLFPEFDLAEIDKNVANSILNDIAKINTELLYYKKLYDANFGLRALEANEISAKFKFNKFKKLKYIVSIIPDDWKKGELESAFNNTTIEGLTEFKLSDEDDKKITKELALAESAIYKFFNSEEISKKLLDPNESKKLFNSVNFPHLLLKPNDAVTISSNDISDSSTLHYLATLIAIDPMSFYKEYSDVLNSKFMPVEALQTAIHEAYAFILNRKVFDYIDDLYNKIVDETIENSSELEIDDLVLNTGFNVAKGAGLNTDAHIQFKRHFFIEGVPGCGKSTACYTYLYKMLLNHPEASKILENVWFIHKSKEQAENAAKEAGFDPAKVTCLTKDEYMKKIYSGYTPFVNSEGLKGNATIETDPDTRIPQYKLTDDDLNTDKVPSLIIIDEATNLSQLDFALSEKFLDKVKRNAICTGDYDLTAVTYSEKIGEKSFTYGTVVNNFAHTIKLGTSLRTENLAKDENIKVVLASRDAIVEAYKNKDNPVKIVLKYSEIEDGDEAGIYGDKFIHGNDITPEVEKSIKLMLDTLKNDENDKLVNFIYSSKDSELYKYLDSLNSSGKYQGKINFINSLFAQGLEGLYYIVDTSGKTINFKENTLDIALIDKKVKNFYTFISRAKLGSLFIGDDFTNANPTSKVLILNVASDKVEKFNLPETEKANLVTRIKSNIVNILEGVTYIPSKYVPEDTPLLNNPPAPNNPNPGPNPKPSGEDDLDDDDPNPTPEKLASLNTCGELSFEPKEYNGHLDCKMLIHSFISNEDGIINESDGTHRLTKTFNDTKGKHDGRIDNFNGLIKRGIIEAESDGTISDDYYNAGLNIIARIKNSIMCAKDKDILESLMDRILGLTGCRIKFYYKTSPHTYEDSKGNTSDTKANNSFGTLRRFWNYVREQLWGIPKDSNPKIQNKKFVAVVYDSDGNAVYETALFNFTNPITLILTKGYEKVYEAYLEYKDNLAPNKHFNFFEFAQILKNNNIENSLQVAKLFELYAKSEAGLAEISKIPGTEEDFLPSKMFENLGPTTTVHEKGKDTYEEYGYEWEEKILNVSDLKQPGRYISSVYMFTDREASMPEVKVGRPFVLVCDSPTENMTEEQMFKYASTWLKYKQTLEEPDDKLTPPVKLIYVTPPSDSIETYLLRYKALTLREDLEDFDLTLGNEMVTQRILYAITREKSEFRKHISELYPELATIVTKLTETRFEALKALAEYILKLPPAEKGRILGENFYDINSEHHDDLIKINEFLDATGASRHLAGDKDTTVRSVLNRAVSLYIVKAHATGTEVDDAVFAERINWVKADLANRELNDGVSISSIFYNIPIKEGGHVWSYGIALAKQLDVENDYTYEGKPLVVKGKVDTATFYGDVSTLLDSILTLLKDDSILNKLLDNYAGKGLKKKSDPPQEEPEIIKKYTGVFTGEAANILKDFKDRVDTNTPLLDLEIELRFALSAGRNGKYYFTDYDGSKIKIIKEFDNKFEVIPDENDLDILYIHTLSDEIDLNTGKKKILDSYIFKLGDNEAQPYSESSGEDGGETIELTPEDTVTLEKLFADLKSDSDYQEGAVNIASIFNADGKLDLTNLENNKTLAFFINDILNDEDYDYMSLADYFAGDEVGYSLDPSQINSLDKLQQFIQNQCF